MRISDWSSDVCSSDLTAAKGAVWSMTRQLAMEGAKHQIRCNSISPGPTVTNQTEAYIKDPAFWDVMGPKIMLGRPGRPEDIAGRSEEHTSELQSLMRISYAVFCLKKKTLTTRTHYIDIH